MTLHHTLSKFVFEEKIEEAEAAAPSEGQKDTAKDRRDKENGYNLGIRRLVQLQIAARHPSIQKCRRAMRFAILQQK